jgi:glyoxylase-like metal-dependent hydrolase (beta-lactamase superfamily II)
MHPAYRLHAPGGGDAGEALARRIEVARHSGVPEAPLRRWAERRRAAGSGQAGTLRADRELREGAVVPTDAGEWRVIETPGHAPSHLCLHLGERRLLISGDHLLGRVSLYFDVGATPDPVGEFLRSLDAVDRLDARLALSGHGRPFGDVAGHIAANRALMAQRLEAVRGALAGGPRTAYEVAREVYGDAYTDDTASWLMAKTLAWLIHLAQGEDAVRIPGSPELWRREPAS